MCYELCIKISSLKEREGNTLIRKHERTRKEHEKNQWKNKWAINGN